MTAQSGRRDLRRVTLRAWTLVWLTLVWLLLWGDVSAANILSGLVVAAGITYLLPLPSVPIEGRVHLLSLARLVVRVTWYLVVSSAQVAWLAVRPARPPLAAVLRAQLNIKSDLVLALAVSVINLIPGSIVLEIDQVRRIIYVHVIDASTDKAVSQFYHQVRQVERLLADAFERDGEWRPAATQSGVQS